MKVTVLMKSDLNRNLFRILPKYRRRGSLVLSMQQKNRLVMDLIRYGRCSLNNWTDDQIVKLFTIILKFSSIELKCFAVIAFYPFVSIPSIRCMIHQQINIVSDDHFFSLILNDFLHSVEWGRCGEEWR